MRTQIISGITDNQFKAKLLQEIDLNLQRFDTCENQASQLQVNQEGKRTEVHLIINAVHA